MEQIFNFVGKGSKMVQCLRCGSIVSAGEGIECRCGHIREFMNKILAAED